MDDFEKEELMERADTIAAALVDKTIQDYRLEDDGRAITFYCAEGNVRLVTEGDCCSTTWIESIDDPDALRGRVLTVEHIDMPDLGTVPTAKRPQVDELVRYYGLKITTERGRVVLDYRNDSNGYYGGNLAVDESIR